MHQPHFRGIGSFPPLELLQRHWERLLNAESKRLDKLSLNSTGVSHGGQRKLDMPEASFCRIGYFGLTTFIPGQIIEQTCGIPDHPVYKGTVRVILQCFLEIFDAFFVVEGVASPQADMEPKLGLC